MTASRFSVIPKKEKTVLTPDQKTFNWLRKQIEDLQEQHLKTTQDLDTALQFYFARIQPQSQTILSILTERVRIAYQLYKSSESFSNQEHKAFKKWIVAEVNEACEKHQSETVLAEMKAVFRELQGVDYEKNTRSELDDFKDNIQEQLHKMGVTIDFSDIDEDGSRDDVMRKVFDQMGESATNQKKSHKDRIKRKKQQEKELKKKAFEEMQKKSISTVYKQLVRTLHPDLEQDSQQKLLKEELMKKLTIAYEKDDFYALFNLEMEWMNRSAARIELQSDERFKEYNALLKDQVKELQDKIFMLVLDSKYAPIAHYCNGFGSTQCALQFEYDSLKKQVQEMQEQVKRMNGPEAEEIFKRILKKKASN